MKKILSFAISAVLFFTLSAQNKPYDESLDGLKQIEQAVNTAKQQNKHVLVQVGGNWCPWCLKFSELAHQNTAIKNIIDSNYVYIHVNYSKANKNTAAMQRLENPARFGFPVFVILDKDGKRIHTQNSSYLEEGKGYNEKLVCDFLRIWTADAIKTYNR
ncbi:MAG: thioredoxin family protein [Bacteroidales bacterium]|nr:thioredoxin family protein [Bacteroidales bacterium]